MHSRCVYCYCQFLYYVSFIEATIGMENHEGVDFEDSFDFEDNVISELSDVSEHSEVSTDDVISQEHWDISSDEFEKDFGDVDEHQTDQCLSDTNDIIHLAYALEFILWSIVNRFKSFDKTYAAYFDLHNLKFINSYNSNSFISKITVLG